MKKVVTIAAAEIPADWIEERRQVAFRDGHALQEGPANSIQIQSIRTGEWLTLTLPNNAKAFHTAEERDQVLAAIRKQP